MVLTYSFQPLTVVSTSIQQRTVMCVEGSTSPESAYIWHCGGSIRPIWCIYFPLTRFVLGLERWGNVEIRRDQRFMLMVLSLVFRYTEIWSFQKVCKFRLETTIIMHSRVKNEKSIKKILIEVKKDHPQNVTKSHLSQQLVLQEKPCLSTTVSFPTIF